MLSPILQAPRVPPSPLNHLEVSLPLQSCEHLLFPSCQSDVPAQAHLQFSHYSLPWNPTGFSGIAPISLAGVVPSPASGNWPNSGEMGTQPLLLCYLASQHKLFNSFPQFNTKDVDAMGFIFSIIYMKVKMKVDQSCPTLQPHGLYSPWNSPVKKTKSVRKEKKYHIAVK